MSAGTRTIENNLEIMHENLKRANTNTVQNVVATILQSSKF